MVGACMLLLMVATERVRGVMLPLDDKRGPQLAAHLQNWVTCRPTTRRTLPVAMLSTHPQSGQMAGPSQPTYLYNAAGVANVCTNMHTTPFDAYVQAGHAPFARENSTQVAYNAPTHPNGKDTQRIIWLILPTGCRMYHVACTF